MFWKNVSPANPACFLCQRLHHYKFRINYPTQTRGISTGVSEHISPRSEVESVLDIENRVQQWLIPYLLIFPLLVNSKSGRSLATVNFHFLFSYSYFFFSYDFVLTLNGLCYHPFCHLVLIVRWLSSWIWRKINDINECESNLSKLLF